MRGIEKGEGVSGGQIAGKTFQWEALVLKGKENEYDVRFQNQGRKTLRKGKGDRGTQNVRNQSSNAPEEGRGPQLNPH